MLNLKFDKFPELQTERLLLREIGQDDTSRLFILRSDPDVMKYIDRPIAKDLSDASNLISIISNAYQTESGITWAVSLKEHPDLIGTIGFWRTDPGNFRAEIGYMLDPHFQGKGLMQEAMEKVLRFGFNTIGLHSVEANVNPMNEKSIRLLQQNKFVKEAYFRENFFFNGRFLDTLIYSLLKSDWSGL